MLIAELLGVPQQDDFAVIFIQEIERFVEALFHLATNGCGGGGELVVLNLGGHIEGGLIAEARGLEPLLAVDVAALGVIAAMQVDDAVLSELPEPHMERQVGLRQVADEAIIRFQEHILNHIAGIDPPGQATIHTQFDHPPQPVAMPFQEFVHRLGVACSRLLQQILCVVRFRPHGVRIPTSILVLNPFPVELRFVALLELVLFTGKSGATQTY